MDSKEAAISIGCPRIQTQADINIVEDGAVWGWRSSLELYVLLILAHGEGGGKGFNHDYSIVSLLEILTVI